MPSLPFRKQGGKSAEAKLLAGVGLAIFFGWTASFCEAASPNDQSPTLTVSSGNTQTGTPGQYAPQPLAVTLKNSEGTALADEPVRFKAKDGLLRASSRAALASEVIVQTDRNGQAQVFFQLPNEPDKYCLVIASAGHGAQDQPVSFMINSDDGKHEHQSPFEATISLESHDDASCTVTWTNTLEGARGFLILRSDDKGKTWKGIGNAPAESRKYTIPAGPLQGMIGHSLFKVEPLVVGPEEELIAKNTPSPVDDPVRLREQRMKAAEARRKERTIGLPGPSPVHERVIPAQ